MVERPGYLLGIDQEILIVGSAIAILCGIADAWDQEAPQVVKSSDWFKKSREVARGDALSDYPDLREVIEAGVSDEEAFRDLLPGVYDRHVRAYFQQLAG